MARDGFYQIRPKNLRGGGDGSTFGSLGSNAGAAGSEGDGARYSTAGEPELNT